MILTFIIITMVIWVFWMALKFYHTAEWDESLESTPDFAQMRKRQAELQHIQEVLAAAQQEGKLSKGLLAEYDAFFRKETDDLERVEREWKERKAAKSPGR